MNWLTHIASTHPVITYTVGGLIVSAVIILIVVGISLYGHFPTDDET